MVANEERLRGSCPVGLVEWGMEAGGDVGSRGGQKFMPCVFEVTSSVIDR